MKLDAILQLVIGLRVNCLAICMLKTNCVVMVIYCCMATRLIIPKCLREQVLQLAHEGHQGIVKTKNRLRSKVR